MALDSDVTGILSTTPQSVETPAGKVVARTAEDAIKLDQYTAAKAAAVNPRRGLRFTVLRAPGAVSGVDNHGAT